MSDTTAPVSTAPAPSPAPPVAPTVTGEITPAQAATMAEWTKEDLAKGKITAEQAEKAFDQLQATPEQRAGDARSAEEKQLDQAVSPRVALAISNSLWPPRRRRADDAGT